MKTLGAVWLAVLCLAAGLPLKSPKDAATTLKNSSMAKVTKVTLPVPGQAPQVVLVTNRTSNVVGTNPPPMPYVSVIYQAPACPGSNRLQYSDDGGKSWTNSVAPPTANNGQWVTNTFVKNTNYTEVFYRAVAFLGTN